MTRRTDPTPGEWGQAVNDAIKNMLKEKRVSGREIAELINRSNGYVGMRLRGEAAFSLDDLDEMGKALGFDPGDFLSAVKTPPRVAPVTVMHNGIDLMTVDLSKLKFAASMMEDSRYLETGYAPE